MHWIFNKMNHITLQIVLLYLGKHWDEHVKNSNHSMHNPSAMPAIHLSCHGSQNPHNGISRMETRILVFLSHLLSRVLLHVRSWWKKFIIWNENMSQAKAKAKTKSRHFNLETWELRLGQLGLRNAFHFHKTKESKSLVGPKWCELWRFEQFEDVSQPAAEMSLNFLLL